MNRIVIFVQGGVVSDVLSDCATEVLVLDKDVEGACDGEVITFCNFEAYPSWFEAAIHPSLVDEAYDIYDKKFSGSWEYDPDDQEVRL